MKTLKTFFPIFKCLPLKKEKAQYHSKIEATPPAIHKNIGKIKIKFSPWQLNWLARHPDVPRCVLDSWSGHIQETTNKHISRWDKLMRFFPLTLQSIKKIKSKNHKVLISLKIFTLASIFKYLNKILSDTYTSVPHNFYLLANKIYLTAYSH